MVAGVVGLLGMSLAAAQAADPSASRSFDTASVAAGGEVVVTMAAANYGGFGRVTETLPAGFSYVDSSLDAEQVNVTGQAVRFTLQGDSSFTYTVTASSTGGTYDFSGMLTDSDRDDHDVGGDSSVTVEAATQQAASASRSFNPDTVAAGGEVVVTMAAANYGGFGRVTETLPAGFSYVDSSLDAEQVNVTGQAVRFTLQGDSSFTYTVTASSTGGTYDFSGMLTDSDRDDHDVGGDSSVTVEAATQQAASASRSFNPDTVAAGGEVVVTMAAANYGGFGRVTETLPAGFSYVPAVLTPSRSVVTTQVVSVHPARG